MALRAQIATLCMILGTVSANVFMNRHHHRGPPDMKDFQQILADMFNPTSSQGILQIKPMNHPGILGFGSFGGPGIGDYGNSMVGLNQGRYGFDDSLPNESPSLEREDGVARDPVYNFDKSTQDVPDFKNENRDQNKDYENRPIKEVGEPEAKEGDQKSDSSTGKAKESLKKESDDESIKKHRDKDAIIFPDKVKQARDKIAKESNFYVSPQDPNKYASSGPQIIYAVLGPSGSTSNQPPFLSNTGTNSIQSQPSENVQNYPTNNVNIQNHQPQYQSNVNLPNGNTIPKNPAYTLVTIPSNGNNGVNSNNPTYVTNNPSYSYPTQQVSYQPPNNAQQYYMVSMNGQNVLIPVSNVQTPIDQTTGENKRFNLVPINQGNYLPTNGQVNYGSTNSPNTPAQTNGQIQYVAFQLQPQNNLQNNNQVNYVPINQGVVQKSAQNTAQEQVNYVPVNAQTVMQMPLQNNPEDAQVSYLSGNTPQIIQVAQQNGPLGSNQVTYVPVSSQSEIQGTSNSRTNPGPISYIPLNSQNPSTASQYNLVPLNNQNNGQNNIVTLTPANLVSDGNVPLIVFKEKAEVTKKEKKHKKN
ncbi:myb-like protein AA isoform X1 [Danaus plexippus]|uniref:myb-like protein AA isoform X1 n=2 Tax=Danaus plexippus TaxID=13037 RepID=UPI002AB13940|nr:myb-like protein AA isoform X1 [Danaus plexippus]